MYTGLSDRWLHTVQTSHLVASRVEVWRGGVELVHDLPVVGGTVTRDFGSVSTLTAEVTVGDPAYLPVRHTDPLTPYGSELRIFVGLGFLDKEPELLQVFSGPIVSTPTWPTRDEFKISAEGWMRYVVDDRFISPYAPAAGLNISAEITRLLQESVPSVGVTFGAGVDLARTVGEGLLWEEDRSQAVIDLADSLGAVVRGSPAGGFVVTKDAPPDPSAAPVREFVHGVGNVLLSRTDPNFTRDERYNAVVAFNSEDPAVPRTLATITDPLDPAMWQGPFGKKVLYYSSPLLTTATVAQAAQTRLDGLKGRTRKVDASILPDPSIEPGDHVRIVWPETYATRKSVEEIVQVRKVVNSLGPGPTELELRGTGMEPVVEP